MVREEAGAVIYLCGDVTEIEEKSEEPELIRKRMNLVLGMSLHDM